MGDEARSEGAKLLRTIRWIIIGVVVWFVFPPTAEIVVMAVAQMMEKPEKQVAAKPFDPDSYLRAHETRFDVQPGHVDAGN